MRMPSAWATLLLLALITRSSPAMASCSSPNWLDQYRSLRTFSVDDCPSSDFRKPLFTRVGTLVCPTRESFMLAYNARSHGWHFVDRREYPDHRAHSRECRFHPPTLRVRSLVMEPQSRSSKVPLANSKRTLVGLRQAICAIRAPTLNVLRVTPGRLRLNGHGRACATRTYLVMERSEGAAITLT